MLDESEHNRAYQSPSFLFAQPRTAKGDLFGFLFNRISDIDWSLKTFILISPENLLPESNLDQSNKATIKRKN